MRILIIEDEVDLADALRVALVEEGYACDVAHDGHTGKHGIQNWVYDLVILDLTLPGIDGRSLLGLLRESQDTPVLVLTARWAPYEKVAMLDAGADDYLTKPFDLAELLARVRSLIRRSASQPNPKIEVAGVEIDLAARTVRREGAVIDLTPKEFALLSFLALRRGAVVSQADLCDHLYSEDEETASNVVAVYVANVRKKLGKDVVRTRRGEGYTIGA